MAIVVDSSALIQLLTRRAGSERVRAELDDEDVIAPELIDPECLRALRRLEATGFLSETGARKALRSLATSSIERVAHRQLLSGAWRHCHDVTAYDAMYVALAEMMRCPLLTADRRLANVPTLSIAVTLIPAN
jgi:predicted nucleic acid-binding protein